MSWFTKILLTLGLAASCNATFAQVDAEPLPGDPKLVVFSYDENNSYRVFARPASVTHIQLDKDEVVKLFTIGDKNGWMVKDYENNVFIKPRFANATTQGSLLTNKRVYQFVFRSSSENGRWYQRVSFIDPADLFVEVKNESRRELQEKTPQIPVVAPAAVTVEQPSGGIRPEDLNADYDITGDEDIRPLVIQDDGTFTYIQFRPGRDVPAIFKMNGEDVELVEFAMTGSNVVKIPRVIPSGLMKLGKQEVRFYNRKLMKKSLFGDYSPIKKGR